MIDHAALDPLGFVADELAARGALVERDDDQVWRCPNERQET